METKLNLDYGRTQKVWFTNPTTLKIKTDGIVTICYLDNARKEIEYTNTNPSVEHPIEFLAIRQISDYIRLTLRLIDGNRGGTRIYPYIDLPQYGYHKHVWTAPGQDTSDEPVNKHFTFPPEETIDEFFLRIQPQIVALAEIVDTNISHTLPHLTANKSNKCGDTDPNHARTIAFNNCANMCGAAIGYLHRELERHVAAYKQWVKDNASVQNPPAFELPEGLLTRDEIETLLEKLQAKFTPEFVKKFQKRHDHGEWAGHHALAKISLPNDDATRTVGEEIHDVRTRHTDGSPELNLFGAVNEFLSISTDEFDKALHSIYDDIVTDRTYDSSRF